MTFSSTNPSCWNGSCTSRQRRLASAVERIESRSQVSAADYASLLWQCGACKSLHLGKRIHAHICSCRKNSDIETFLRNLLVQMYSQCGSLQNAIKVFHQIPLPDSSSWNVMIAAYIEHGDLISAREIFDQALKQDPRSWNSIVAAHTRYGHYREAIELLSLMDFNGYYPDKYSFVAILVACSRLGELELARALYGDICSCGIQTETVVGTAIVDVFGKCGCVQEAKEAFDRVENKNVKTWTAMVAAYAQRGDLDQARELFDQMPERTIISWNVLVAAYSQKGLMDEAREVFDKMIWRDVISWTSLIAGYVDNGQPEKAIHSFQLMLCHGVKPNQVTYTRILDACTSAGDIKLGRNLHSQIRESGFGSFISVGNSLITMFGRFGLVIESWECFDKMAKRNTISWTALIQAYARNGFSSEALSEFHNMELEGMKPNHVTLLSVLTACVHGGLEELARDYITSLGDSYGLKAGAEHFGCLVDLLARSGKMSEALEVVESMPFEPGVVEWTSLASGCVRSGGDKWFVEIARENLCRIEKRDSGPFMLLAHAYTSRHDKSKLF